MHSTSGSDIRCGTDAAALTAKGAESLDLHPAEGAVRKLLKDEPMDTLSTRLPLLRQLLFLVLAALLLTPWSAAAVDPQPPDPCLELEEDSHAALEALTRLRITSGGNPREVREVRLTGLRSLDEARVWRLIGRRPPGPLTTEQVAMVVVRVAQSGLFRRVEPRLHVEAEEGATLELVLEEFPRLEQVQLRGLTEVSETRVLDALLRGPREDDDEDAEERGFSRCPPPLPPRQLLARRSGDRVEPGILWEGVPAALTRVMDALDDDGYLMASLQAQLTPDGVLTLEIDEGRLESLELHGVPEGMKAQVLAELDLEPGRVFTEADVEAALRRVTRRFPFLEEGEAGPRRDPARRKVVEEQQQGQQTYRVEEGERRARRHRVTLHVDSEEEEDQEFSLPFGIPLDWSHSSSDAVQVEGRTARLYFDQDRTDLDTDWLELLRHTPVTGFAPGLGLTGWLYDPQNRAHLGVDASLSLNTSRSAQPVDFLVGPKVQLPGLFIAELGGQIYALTETSDRWRVSRIDSYLHSMIVSHPHADYYRRTGVSAFVTAHLARQFTVGAEYRNDLHASMETVVGPTFLAQTAHFNPSVDEGRMGSMVLRAEWSTQKVGLDQVGGRRRAPELSVVDRDWYGELEPGFQTVNTAEFADPRLGGRFQFFRVVSDNGFHLRTGDDQGLRLRVRAAGGRDLPAQKREALGGWNALRGYDFKEFEGDLSVLAMAEYHFGFLSAFADGGTVRAATGWLAPKVGLGAAINLGSHFQVAAAWRTDERARLLPEFKAVLNRTF